MYTHRDYCSDLSLFRSVGCIPSWRATFYTKTRDIPTPTWFCFRTQIRAIPSPTLPVPLGEQDGPECSCLCRLDHQRHIQESIRWFCVHKFTLAKEPNVRLLFITALWMLLISGVFIFFKSESFSRGFALLDWYPDSFRSMANPSISSPKPTSSTSLSCFRVFGISLFSFRSSWLESLSNRMFLPNLSALLYILHDDC